MITSEREVGYIGQNETNRTFSFVLSMKCSGLRDSFGFNWLDTERSHTWSRMEHTPLD